MSSLVPETNWAQGASGTGAVYDNSPSGLGLTPSYLAGGATASASASISTSVVTGIVASTGAITGGSGFSVVHSGTGAYIITLAAAMSTTPVVTVTTIDAAGNSFANVTSVSMTGFEAETGIPAAGGGITLADKAFNFIATAVK